MRLADVPIARINNSGYGLDNAAARTTWYVLYEGPQSLFVDDEGRAFCVPQGCALMLRWIESHRAWWVGNFSVQRGEPLRRHVMTNLRERWRELRTIAA